MLCTMPLQSLLDWLFKPKGPTLTETSVKVAPYKTLAIAITKRMLYEEKPPLVGVGLVYKLHYISTVPFSAAYMHLNVWHSAASNKESENRLDEPCLLFMNISVMSYLLQYETPSYWISHLRRRWEALVSLCLLSPSEL